MSEDLDRTDYRGRTPLIRACEEGDLEQVQRLIDKGANVEATAMKKASLGGHAAIVELLIRKGVDINDSRDWKTTALILASMGGHVDVVDCLLSLGADLELMDQFGLTALMMSGARGKIDP